MNIGQVFFYINGIPTNGAWLDMESLSTWEEIGEALAAEGYQANGGDIFVADAEGFAKCFTGKYGDFDLVKFVELRDDADSYTDWEAYSVYVDNISTQYASFDDFQDSYQGKYGSKEEFVEDLYNRCYDIPDHLQNYIDWEKVARDFFCGDYIFIDGHVFISI